jgi:type IV pilus assembly protein PilW
MVGPALGRRRASAGYSLLELLVASAIGLLVLTLVLAQLLALGRSQALRSAQGQLMEDGQIALELLRGDFMMLGYGRPLQALGADPIGWRTSVPAPALLACDQGFASTPQGAAPTCVQDAAQAGGPAAGSSAVELVFEADIHNTLVSSSKVPTDCLGNALDPIELAEDGQVHLAFNRWQISPRNELRCGGRGPSSAQPLVENVERMRLWWGLPVDAQPASALRYVPASQVADFGQVRAVRLCLLVRSRDPVLGADEVRTYRDCNGAVAASGDGRLRRAFWTTVAFRSWSL